MAGPKTFFDALPVAATSPLALFGYVVAIIGSAILVTRSQRNSNLLSRIQHIPQRDRKALIQAEMGVVLPKDISAEQWLKSRLQFFLFCAFAVLCLCVTFVAAITVNSIQPTKKIPLPTPSDTLVPNPNPTPSPVASSFSAPQPAPTAKIAGPVFSPPMLEGRTVDGCIRSAQFEAFEQQCSSSAQHIIPAAFCAKQGYSGAESWSGEDTGVRQNSFKLVRELAASGYVQQGFVTDDGGGYILTTVKCE